MYSWAPVEIPSIPASQDVPRRLRLHDSSSARTIPVGPAEGEARIYVCGITPYDATHLGHASTYLTFDLVNRVWRDLGLKVNYVQNVTDVDDPLLERAAATGQDWEELAEDQTELFRSDMTALRIIPPDHYVGAVESIPCVVELIEKLLSTGLVYQVEDPEHPDWYFNTASAPGFGEVSHYDEERMLKIFAERGGDPDRPGKRHPLDCLLWRFARPSEPSWTSALGDGRPGWHIECTAISLHHLGPCFDVQGGGTDLVFPHHEMCAAEARAVTGVPMAGAYVHSGMVALDGEKMSKSRGNLELVSRLRQRGADPMAIRLALLGQHYRSDWEWDSQLLERATRRLSAWRALRNIPATRPTEEIIAEMRRALRNDLDAPLALDIVDEWAAASIESGGKETDGYTKISSAVDALLGVKL